ncbi:pectinesterase family protein [Clostridium felsineum]|uniref:pectinesterase family protein n=1 Tax=Clostridium felsineum TaxID=36839 RepID=UPI0009CFB007|nr:pectinesterase family protein [Clostridium felsineum]URZ04385.1 Pectinesterase A [Clostridium felsineum]
MNKKSILTIIMTICGTLLIGGLSTSAKTHAATNYNSIVDSAFTGTNGSTVNGIPTYKDMTSALTNAPTNSTAPYNIFIKAGTYHEKLTIDRPNIHLIGENENTTKLSYDAASGTKKADGTTYGTSGSASVSVIAPDFSAENVTFENAFDYPSNAAKSNDDPTKLASPQAVALKLDVNSQRAYFKNCKLTGYQDTLEANEGTAYFKRCYITGNIDFIFGAGQTYFDKCDVVSMDMKSTVDNGYVTAPSTLITNKYGFVFHKCRLTKQSKSMAANTVALGRPWHPTTTFPDGRYANPNAIGSSVYINCHMDDHIKTDGWSSMPGKDINGNTILFTPSQSRFFEYKSRGNGAVINTDRRQLTTAEAKYYSKNKVLNGWNPQ